MQDRKDEQGYLAALLTDVEAVIAETERTLAANLELQLRSDDRIAALRASNGTVADSLLLGSSRGHGTVSRSGTSLDAYRDLVSSGGVTKLTDSEVRQAMARLASSMAWEEGQSLSMIDGAMEVNREAAVIAAQSPGQLAAFLIRAEENGQVYRDFHSRAKRATQRAAEEAREAILTSMESR